LFYWNVGTAGSPRFSKRWFGYNGVLDLRIPREKWRRAGRSDREVPAFFLHPAVGPVLEFLEQGGLDHGEANADAAAFADPHEAVEANAAFLRQGRRFQLTHYVLLRNGRGFCELSCHYLAKVAWSLKA